MVLASPQYRREFVKFRRRNPVFAAHREPPFTMPVDTF